MDTNKFLHEITEFYLSSGDFNGVPKNHLAEEDENITPILTNLLQADKIICNFGDRHPNPHILALAPEPKEEQIKKLNESRFCCIYPSAKHLKSIINPDDYKGEPYKLEMAMGEPQLVYRAFNLIILEQYRSDPRFFYRVDDINGSISAKSEQGLSEDNEVFIQTFGFAYDKEIKHRYVAVYLRYLSQLSPEHQQKWKLEEFNGETFLHPDYARSTAGYWPEKESIFNAFCEEIKIINKITNKINGISLFRNSYDSDNKPREFGFLIRPTKKEYEDFAHLLDKMISDNIEKKFFEDKIELFELEKKRDNYIEKPKGTIRLLDEWLDIAVKLSDPTLKNEMISIFKEIRKERQPQAHHVRENKWDDSLFSKQRDLIIKAYIGIKTLREIFATHPAAKTIHIPKWLLESKVWTY